MYKAKSMLDCWSTRENYKCNCTQSFTQEILTHVLHKTNSCNDLVSLSLSLQPWADIGSPGNQKIHEPVLHPSARGGGEDGPQSESPLATLPTWCDYEMLQEDQVISLVWRGPETEDRQWVGDHLGREGNMCPVRKFIGNNLNTFLTCCVLEAPFLCVFA